MQTFARLTVLLGLSMGTLLWHAAPAAAQTRPGMTLEPQSPEAALVNSATDVLAEIMTIPARGIPHSLLADAEGIAIVPGMIKGGFVVGIRHGHGVVVARDQAGGWQLPTVHYVDRRQRRMAGGFTGDRPDSGLQDQEERTGDDQREVHHRRGCVRCGRTRGRDAAVATDATLKAEIYSYSRSRGLFAGVALDGTALQVDGGANARYYRPIEGNAIPGQAAQAPASAVRLLDEIAKYTAAPAVGPGGPADVPEGRVVPDALAVQRQLGESSRRLSALVDDRWKAYLALPAEVYNGQRPAAAEALAPAAARFQAVAANPQYRTLAQRPEFQETFQLLQQVLALQAKPSLALPPPPK